MTALRDRRDIVFYSALFALWTLMLFIRYAGYNYLGSPLPSAGTGSMNSGAGSLALLQGSLAELRKNLVEEKDPKEIPHLLQNIGCAYYDLYKATGDRTLIDSALGFINQSIVESPGIARFHYNFGRMFTEIGNQTRALQEYDLAIRCDPSHMLALSNAGTCAYFAFNRRKTAASYFSRALAIDSLMPMCNVVLGLISLDEKDYTAARTNFEKELIADAGAVVKNRYPLSLENINYAAFLSHQNLMILYSTKFPDKSRAKEHLDAACKFEPDSSKREGLIREFERYWGK